MASVGHPPRTHRRSLAQVASDARTATSIQIRTYHTNLFVGSAPPNDELIFGCTGKSSHRSPRSKWKGGNRIWVLLAASGARGSSPLQWSGNERAMKPRQP